MECHKSNRAILEDFDTSHKNLRETWKAQRRTMKADGATQKDFGRTLKAKNGGHKDFRRT